MGRLNTTLLDWMETGGRFSAPLQAWGVAAWCCWISITSSPVLPALCPKGSLTLASPKLSTQEEAALSLCTAIFPGLNFCSSALI